MSKKDNVPVNGEEKESGKLRVSRRDFLKGLGTGTVAAAVMTTAGPKAEAEAAPPKGIREAVIQTEINGRVYRLAVKTHWTLLDVLRTELGLTGTKKSCDRGSCGACTVIMDGMAVDACSLLAVEADKRKITTIEGLSDGEILHPIQAAFMREDALQCGFCTPAMIMSTKALLDKNPRPSPDEIKEALAGNICRCSAYPKIVKAAMSVAQKA
ncbi:MAG TPA: 2Fe-2S iron-sulfur cluster-binding protein [Syntrophorhabdales bacterium]|nr:2Fe-2S iron-sulfur cluster-binding protein [Syntrophorhabdales bacterium]